MDSLPARRGESTGAEVLLTCPGVGRFRPRKILGEPLQPGAVLGILSVLNRRYEVAVPVGCWGLVTESLGFGSHDVEYGSKLVTLNPDSDAAAELGAAAAESEAAAAAAGEEVIRSPIDGIFYCRPEPGAPPFVSAGDPIRPGQVVGLVEVMKTFNPIRWQPGSSAEAVVLRVEVEDHQEVSSGQILLTLDSGD